MTDPMRRYDLPEEIEVNEDGVEFEEIEGTIERRYKFGTSLGEGTVSTRDGIIRVNHGEYALRLKDEMEVINFLRAMKACERYARQLR